MINKRVLSGAALAITALGLTVPQFPIHADSTDARPSKQQVQVKFEWVRDQAPPSKTLTLATTTDTTGTVSLEPSAPGGERASATIQPHVNADNTITVRFNVDRFQNGMENRIISQRTLKPGERVFVGGLGRTSHVGSGPVTDGQSHDVIADIGSETHTEGIFMTATTVPPDDGKLTGMTGFGRGGF